MNKDLKTTLKLISDNFGIGVAKSAEERYEQINKHGFSIKADAKYYKKGELVEAARFCLGVGLWPNEWDSHFRDKILLKSMVERYKIAPALLCAEIDRYYSL